LQGSKRRRGDSWELTVSDGFDINGKRIRHTRTIKPVFNQQGKLVALSSAEADNELRDFIKEIQGRVYAGRMTVAAYMDYWYKTFIDPENIPETVRTYKPKTKRWYKMNIENHIKPRVGHILLRELTSHDIKRMLNDITAETGNEKESIDGVFRTLRTALESAVGVYIEINPAKNKVARPIRATKRETKAKHSVFTLEQAIIFLDTAKRQWLTAPGAKEYNRLAIYACYYTALLQAMRQSELLGLRWSDLDLDKRVIDIRQQLAVGGPNPKFDTLKTETSYRQIRMAQSVADLLRQLQHYQDLEKEKAQKNLAWHYYDLVFCQDNGLPLYPQTLTRHHLKETIRLANEAAETDVDKLPVIRFQDLRGSTASLLYEMGEDPWTIASILGHATPQTGQDGYPDRMALS
jgi:integrase